MKCFKLLDSLIHCGLLIYCNTLVFTLYNNARRAIGYILCTSWQVCGT